MRAAALATEFGFAVVGSLVGGIFVGQAVDRRLDTAPAFFLVGLVLGLIVSVYLMYAIYRIQVVPRRAATAGAPVAHQERAGVAARQSVADSDPTMDRGGRGSRVQSADSAETGRDS